MLRKERADELRGYCSGRLFSPTVHCASTADVQCCKLHEMDWSTSDYNLLEGPSGNLRGVLYIQSITTADG